MTDPTRTPWNAGNGCMPQLFRIDDIVQIRQDGSAPAGWAADLSGVRLRVLGAYTDGPCVCYRLHAASFVLPGLFPEFCLEPAPAILPAAPSRRWRHAKRGTVYEEIGRAELQASYPVMEGAVMVIYRGTDGKLWTRHVTEFEDGRFEEIDAATDAETPPSRPTDRPAARSSARAATCATPTPPTALTEAQERIAR